MRHIKLNGTDFVIWKEHPDGRLELVDPEGFNRTISREEASRGIRAEHHLPIEPASQPFNLRPRSFVEELQLRRVAYLRENQSKKRTDKGPRVGEPVSKRPKGTKRVSKTKQLMDQLIQQRLAAAGITNPATLDMLKNSLT